MSRLARAGGCVPRPSATRFTARSVQAVSPAFELHQTIPTA